MKCQSSAKNKQKTFKYGNPNCNKTFKRKPSDVSSSGIRFCSKSCAAIVNNKKFPKRHPKIKTCLTCGKKFSGDRKYCSSKCIPKPPHFNKKQIIKAIKKFYNKNGRILLKRESHHHTTACKLFGCWNNAIQAAGFEPNPVKFAKKYIANDDHKCDSLSEKIIDDWFYARRIKHQTNVPYPGNNGLTVDFLIRNWWVEFFGLSGELKRCDKGSSLVQ